MVPRGMRLPGVGRIPRPGMLIQPRWPWIVLPGLLLMPRVFHANAWEDRMSAPYDEVRREGQILLWIKDGKVTAAWLNSGNTCIHVLLRATADPDAMMVAARKLAADGKLPCGTCGKVFHRAVMHRHMTSVFCVACWERYRTANSETCMICGQPRYACCC